MTFFAKAPTGAPAGTNAARTRRSGAAPPREACAHCGDPVPEGALAPADELSFCCAGCRAAHALLRETGLEHYYELRESAAQDALATRPSGRDFHVLDDPAFAAEQVRTLPDGSAETMLILENVHCAACVWLVERLPRLVDGVIEARLDVGRRTVRVRWWPERARLSQIASALDRTGYPPHPFRAGESDLAQRREWRRDLIDVGLAGALAGNTMLLAFGLWGGSFASMEPAHEKLLRLVSFGLALFAVAVPGRAFFRRAYAGLRARTLHVDLPIALALGLGTLWGGWNSLTGRGEVYFESITMIVFLLLAGRMLQRSRQRRAQEEVELLAQVMPAAVRRRRSDGRVEEVALEALAPGDLVELRAGDLVPVDGVVEEGVGEVDTALLTGESTPSRVEPGSRVHAGTQCLAGGLAVRAEAAGRETRVGKLMELVRRFAAERSRTVELADRIAHRFVAVVLTATVVTAIVWWQIAPEWALERAITLLIVTCPCALGLATPLAMVAGIGQAARRGLLIKGSTALDRLAERGHLVLDKTGTLTRGTPRVVGWHGDDAVRPLVAALEAKVLHPLATALARDLVAGDGAAEATAPEVVCVEAVPGRGLVGEVRGADGRLRRLRVGAPRFAAPEGAPRPAGFDAAIEAALAAGRTAVVVSEELVSDEPPRVLALAELEDDLVPDAALGIARLRSLGLRPALLSGDDPRVVRAVALRLGIDPREAIGGADPEAKVAHVRALRASAPVVMVGDGVNDAGAHAAADVGVAVHGAAEANLAAADVHLGRAGLTPLVELVEGARRVRGTVKLGFAVSLSYNLLTGGLAVAGIITPMIAALLMPISSLSVITLAFRRRAFGPPGDSIRRPQR